jgi:hypothetical protein
MGQARETHAGGAGAHFQVQVWVQGVPAVANRADFLAAFYVFIQIESRRL